MSQSDKLIKRVLSVPSDLTYEELKQFLKIYDFLEGTKGKTSGSRVKFFRKSDAAIILLHKPHPENIVGRSTIRKVIDYLREAGVIYE